MPTILHPSPVFGPVTSRRLGRSLGINLLPADGKVCNFDCVYCECGLNAQRRPRQPLPTEQEVLQALGKRLSAMSAAGEELDAITFAGNGEPTSHPAFARILAGTAALRTAWYPKAAVCVLTNATRLGNPAIAQALMQADRPCLKLDAVSDAYVRLVNRPSTPYRAAAVVAQMERFAGRCIVQAMFMQGDWMGESVDNTDEAHVGPWLEALARIRPAAVDIYTIARDTPGANLRKVSMQVLESIAGRVRQLGIDARCFG